MALITWFEPGAPSPPLSLSLKSDQPYPTPNEPRSGSLWVALNESSFASVSPLMDCPSVIALGNSLCVRISAKRAPMYQPSSL